MAKPEKLEQEKETETNAEAKTAVSAEEQTRAEKEAVEKKEDAKTTADAEEQAKVEKEATEKKAEAERQAEENAALEDRVGLRLRHKSHTLYYHRCGLRITKQWADYEVSVEDALLLKADKWIEIEEDDE